MCVCVCVCLCMYVCVCVCVCVCMDHHHHQSVPIQTDRFDSLSPPFLLFIAESLHGVTTKVLLCGVEVTEFDPSHTVTVTFRLIYLEKHKHHYATGFGSNQTCLSLFDLLQYLTVNNSIYLSVLFSSDLSIYLSMNNIDMFCQYIFVYILSSCRIDFIVSGGNRLMKLL